MKKNVGTTDKIIRVLAALLIVAGYITHMLSGTAAIILGVLAGLLLLTAFTGFCPLYLPFGIHTSKKEN